MKIEIFEEAVVTYNGDILFVLKVRSLNERKINFFNLGDNFDLRITGIKTDLIAIEGAKKNNIDISIDMINAEIGSLLYLLYAAKQSVQNFSDIPPEWQQFYTQYAIEVSYESDLIKNLVDKSLFNYILVNTVVKNRQSPLYAIISLLLNY